MAHSYVSLQIADCRTYSYANMTDSHITWLIYLCENRLLMARHSLHFASHSTLQAAMCVPLVPGSNNASGNRRVPLIPFPSHSGSDLPGVTGKLPSLWCHDFISRQKIKLYFFSQGSEECRTMRIECANKAVLGGGGRDFGWNPWILKQKISTFGTVISVADNVEMDSE